MSANELVSVIIPTCDRPWFLHRAVRSVISQSYENVEVIVVNDGRSEVVLDSHPRLKVISAFPTSKSKFGYGSGGYARNLGLQEAAGKYVMFLDDDDLFLPRKVETQIAYMKKTGAKVCCTDAYIGITPFFVSLWVKRFSEYYWKILAGILGNRGLKSIPAEIDSDLLLSHNFVITSTVAIERQLLREAGNFTSIKNGGQLINGQLDYQDWEAWRRVSRLSLFHYLNEPTVYYKRGSLKKFMKKWRAKLSPRTNLFRR